MRVHWFSLWRTRGNNAKERIRSMHVVIHHSIQDSEKWEQNSRRIRSMIEQNRLPKGVTPLEYLPSVDGHKAVCLWEADSVNMLKVFIERETAGSARNDYFEVNVEDSIGLPKVEKHDVARAA
jgi:hypothetical protein